MASEENSNISSSGVTVGPDPVSGLRDLIQRGQKRRKTCILLESVGIEIAVPLAYLWLVFWVDNVFHLPVWGRIFANVLFLAGIALLAWHAFYRWRKARFTEDQTALAIEKRTPDGVENRLINAIQLSRTSDVPVGRTVVKENCLFLRQVDLGESTERWPALIPVIAAVLLVLVGVIFWVSGRERFSNAASRIFLPFANIDPIYETILTIKPGDVDAAVGQDVEISITIAGQVPDGLWILTDQLDEQASERIMLEPDKRHVNHTFISVSKSMAYAVRGGDFMTRWYRINVPTLFRLKQLISTYRYPDYTHMSTRKFESAIGDLEALFGTRASLKFVFNQPAEKAWLLLNRTNGRRIALRKIGDAEFAGEIVFANVSGYELEGKSKDQGPVKLGPYKLKVATDQPPDLQLTGIDQQDEVMIDAVMPLTMSARDDYGLLEVGLFYRVTKRSGGVEQAENPPSNDWQVIQSWLVDKEIAEFEREHALVFSLLEVAEGERIDMALRARDTDPLKNRRWTTGPRHEVMVTGTGSELQVLYERILRMESDLKSLIASLGEQMRLTDEWIRKLNPSSGLRWDDQKNLDALASAMKVQAKKQIEAREKASQTAREMVAQTEGLSLSVGMLADTEMVRCVRILEAVPKRENPQSKRSALSDARLTHQRCSRTLEQVLAKYVEFRKGWERSHMLPFAKMLADRQTRMADASLTYAELSTNVVGRLQRKAVSRRQSKLRELSGLAQKAFAGMSEQKKEVGEFMASALKEASKAFDDRWIMTDMTRAHDQLAHGEWLTAEPHQRRAAESLTTMYRDLRKAQTVAAQKALEDLQKLTASDLEAQKKIAKLKEGSGENLLDVDEDEMDLEDIVHIRKLAENLKNKQHSSVKDKVIDYMFEEHMKSILGKHLGNKEQDFSLLKLADKPTGEMSFPNSSDREGNRVKPQIQEKFDDLVGDLLEEADDLRDDYETYNLNVAWKINEPGEVGKQGGDLNSTAAAAATGNMKPPSGNFGGASRTGRQGARAHGLAVGDESINRRGREEAQEGQEEVPDQAGEMKETLSSDPQQDTSTGVGGKKVGEKQSSFSTKDAGEWKDEMAEKMAAPKTHNQIVERKGKPLDHRVAEMMRDLANSQEQLIKRIKALKKELDQLYLPTDHLDEIMKQLASNLDSFKEKPDAEVFRRQIETLDKLKSTVVVFNRASSNYEQGLIREQTIKGRILDEPAWPTIPAYEDAVNIYYEKLSGL